MTCNPTDLAAAIKREAEADPPLTREQRNKLAMLLYKAGDAKCIT